LKFDGGSAPLANVPSGINFIKVELAEGVRVLVCLCLCLCLWQVKFDPVQQERVTKDPARMSACVCVCECEPEPSPELN